MDEVERVAAIVTCTRGWSQSSVGELPLLSQDFLIDRFEEELNWVDGVRSNCHTTRNRSPLEVIGAEVVIMTLNRIGKHFGNIGQSARDHRGENSEYIYRNRSTRLIDLSSTKQFDDQSCSNDSNYGVGHIFHTLTLHKSNKANFHH
jgi:hypothetical protein